MPSRGKSGKRPDLPIIFAFLALASTLAFNLILFSPSSSSGADPIFEIAVLINLLSFNYAYRDMQTAGRKTALIITTVSSVLFLWPFVLAYFKIQ